VICSKGTCGFPDMVVLVQWLSTRSVGAATGTGSLKSEQSPRHNVRRATSLLHYVGMRDSITASEL
jgi:hypothetical protein